MVFKAELVRRSPVKADEWVRNPLDTHADSSKIHRFLRCTSARPLKTLYINQKRKLTDKILILFCSEYKPSGFPRTFKHSKFKCTYHAVPMWADGIILPYISKKNC